MAASSVVLTMQGGLMWQAYGLYVPIWQRDEGWSAVALAVAFSVYQGASVLLSPLQGLMLRAVGPRRAIQLGIVAAGGGMAAIAVVTSLPAFFAAIVVTGLGFSLCGGMSFSAIMINWFERRRARALAFMQAGKGVGGLIVLGVAASLATYGWRPTMMASGLLFALVGLAVAASLRDTPESCGLCPDGDQPAGGGAGAAPSDGGAGRVAPADRGMTATAALRTRAFWQIGVAHGLLAMVVTGLVAHLGAHLQGVGFSLTFAATMVALVTIAATVGLLTAGAVGDRVSKRHVTAAAAGGHGLAVLALALSTGPGAVYAFVLLHGFSWGLRDPLMQALRADYFGRAAFVTVEGVARLFLGIGMVSGPIVVALVRDGHGDFSASFLLLAAASFVGAALLATARPPRGAP